MNATKLAFTRLSTTFLHSSRCRILHLHTTPIFQPNILFRVDIVTMLAAHHNQENLYTHQAGASKPQLQAKTPGSRFPITPLKVPLNDENTHHGFGWKNVLKAKGNNENILTIGKGGHVLGNGGKQALVTPAGMAKSFTEQSMPSSKTC